MIDDLLCKVESRDTDLVCGLASGVSHFIYIVEQLDVYKKLVKIDKNSVEAARIEKRIMRLIEEEVDHRYANPYDSAISVYLMSLYDIGHYNYKKIAEDLLHKSAGKPFMYWSFSISKLLLSGKGLYE